MSLRTLNSSITPTDGTPSISVEDSTTNLLLERVLEQLVIMNIHLQAMTDEEVNRREDFEDYD